MLSDENKGKIVFSGLYKREPDPSKCYERTSPYHCRNWTFRPHEYDGKVFMTDTYFGNGNTYLVTDENIDEFEFVFDFNKVKRIPDDEHDEYSPEDLFRVATGSGGFSCGGLFWVNKDARRSKDLLIEKQTAKIEFYEWKLKWAIEELEMLADGSHYKLQGETCY